MSNKLGLQGIVCFWGTNYSERRNYDYFVFDLKAGTKYHSAQNKANNKREGQK